MNLQQLNYFLVSARSGSLTKAAEELYTTQPHVSQVIRSLEKELGVKLFQRTGTGIVLTQQGEDIRFYAENMQKNASLIEELCMEQRQDVLKIAANSSSRLACLGEQYFIDQGEESFSLTYTECGTEKMLELLQYRNYDMGFLFVPDNKRSAFEHMIRKRHLQYTPLLASDLVVHSGPMSPFYGRELITPDELDQCRCIQLEDDFFSVEDLLLTHKDFRSGRYRIRKVIRTNSDHLMIRMLQETPLCNIGSYWLKGSFTGQPFTISVIDGFQRQVSFGYLARRGKTFGEEAELFLKKLQDSLEKERSGNLF